jgi:hypothetical protein
MKEGKIKGKERSKKKKTNTEKLKKTEKGEKHAPPYFQTGKKKKATLPGPVVSNTLTRQRSSE